jgi:glycine oxidase
MKLKVVRKIANLGVYHYVLNFNNILTLIRNYSLHHYQFIILGAGLAGMTLSAQLSRNNIDHLVIDISNPGSGASGTPAGLLNPATSQKAKFHTHTEKCITAFDELLKVVSKEVDLTGTILSDSIVRPALDSELETNFKSTLQSGDWPNGWIDWIDKEALIRYGPIAGSGGLFVKVGYAIDFRSWLKQLIQFSTSRTATLLTNTSYENLKLSDGFEIRTQNDVYRAPVLIDCTGSNPLNKNGLRWTPVKGQTRVVKTSEPVHLDTAISGYGYLIKNGDSLILGSTYEHHFKDEMPDAKKDKPLLDKLSMLNLDRNNTLEITERWSGVRVSTPDRLPALGALDENPMYHYFMGLGSKGLLYSAWLSEILVQHLINNESVPDIYHVKRLHKQRKG